VCEVKPFSRDELAVASLAADYYFGGRKVSERKKVDYSRVSVVGKAAEALEELYRRFAVAGMSRQEFILTLVRSVDPQKLSQAIEMWAQQYYAKKKKLVDE